MTILDAIDSSPIFGWAIGALVVVCLVSNAVEARIAREGRGR